MDKTKRDKGNIEIDTLIDKSLSKILDEEFGKRLEKLVSSVTDEHFKSTNRRIDTIQKTIDNIGERLGEDRRDISDVNVGLKKIEAMLSGTRADIADQTKQMVHKVDEVLQPVGDIVADQVKDSVNKEMSNKKIVFVRPKGLIKRIFRR